MMIMYLRKFETIYLNLNKLQFENDEKDNNLIHIKDYIKQLEEQKSKRVYCRPTESDFY